MSHPCLWVGHSPHVLRLSYLWNHYLFISPSILFKLGLMELGTNRQVRGCPRGGSLQGRAQGSDVGPWSYGCDMSLMVPQHHPAPGTATLPCPWVRTSVTAILQVALRCGKPQSTVQPTLSLEPPPLGAHAREGWLSPSPASHHIWLQVHIWAHPHCCPRGGCQYQQLLAV